ncbi:MAG: signal peptide peptidase SppA [Candidatus Aminicenantes bacterium]|nr:signal peptide peptidase SppA [Candidatus Aminicenantes bacterium]
MRKHTCLILVLILLLSRCSFHIDLLGKDTIQEVVLVDSKAKDKILIIDISGIIGMALKPGLLERESDIVSRVYSRLQKASEDRRVKGIILRLDTPGGEVTASDILFNEIRKFRDNTDVPVVSLMMGVAASGGYYIAAASDHIIAHPSTITGSIGVISLFPNLEELFAKIGVEINVIKSGSMKDSGSAFRDLTDDEKAVFQTVVDELYTKFLDVVLEGRRGALTLDELKTIADGRIYTAQQALSLKLIDEIGYYDAALSKVMSLAGIEDARIITYTYYPKQKTNIYATQLAHPSMFETKDFQSLFHSLKSGFYYLWLPQISR